MISPEDDFIINLSASCTKEQAVLRLMGWGVDTIYKKHISVNQDGTLDIKSEKLNPSELSLNGVLSDIYQAALKAYSDDVSSMDVGDDIEEILELRYPEIERAEALIERAKGHLLDIVDELSKGSESKLRLDKSSSGRTDEDLITIRSLDEWAKQQYKNPMSVNVDVAYRDDGASTLDKEEAKTSKAELSTYVSLALLAELYAKKYKSALSPDGGVNISLLADHVCTHGSTWMPSDVTLDGQSVASVKKRLQKGFTYKQLLRRSIK